MVLIKLCLSDPKDNIKSFPSYGFKKFMVKPAKLKPNDKS